MPLFSASRLQRGQVCSCSSGQTSARPELGKTRRSQAPQRLDRLPPTLQAGKGLVAGLGLQRCSPKPSEPPAKPQYCLQPRTASARRLDSSKATWRQRRIRGTDARGGATVLQTPRRGGPAGESGLNAEFWSQV